MKMIPWELYEREVEKLKMPSSEIRKILDEHVRWARKEEGGRRADFKGAYLVGANFEGEYLEGANFEEAILMRANFEGASLKGANLRGADLGGANLRRAILNEADLSGANLSRADLRSAHMREADFKGADLDFSALPFHYGSFSAYFDDKQIIQIAYHMVRAGLNSINTSDETKAELTKLIDFANKSHLADDGDKIVYENSKLIIV